MKIRTGFVSNSSSSSFVVAYKGDIPSTKAQMLDFFGVVPGKPGEKVFMKVMEKIFDGEDLSIDYLLKDFRCDTVEQLLEEGGLYMKLRVDLLNSGWKVKLLFVDYNEELLSSLLQNIDTDTLKIFEG